MSRKAQTKDEKFLIALYEALLEAGDFDLPRSRYEIGLSVGLQYRAVNAICNQLIKTNFIKKNGEEEIILTENGRALAVRLLEE